MPNYKLGHKNLPQNSRVNSFRFGVCADRFVK